MSDNPNVEYKEPEKPVERERIEVVAVTVSIVCPKCYNEWTHTIGLSYNAECPKCDHKITIEAIS